MYCPHFYGACMRHAFALHFASGLCTLAIIFTGWAMFSSGFGEVVQSEATAGIGDKKVDPTTGVMVVGSFMIFFLFLGSVLHGHHGHRVHNEEGGMCGRKSRSSSYSKQQQTTSTEMVSSQPPPALGV